MVTNKWNTQCHTQTEKSAKEIRILRNLSTKLVKNEEQRQALLQGVELHRKSFQKPTKEELKKDVRASFNS